MRKPPSRLRAIDPVPDKTALYFAPSPAHAARFLATLRELEGCAVRSVPGGAVFESRAARLHFEIHHSPARAHAALRHRFFNLVLLDVRDAGHSAARLQADFKKTLRLLDLMDEEHDVERRYGFHRILAMVSGNDSVEIDRMIATFGGRGVGRVLRDTSTCPLDGECPKLPRAARFCRVVVDELIRMTGSRKAGKVALCASGGGITGIYFEMGALKCLDDCLPAGALNSFDMYFGISAGSVVTGILANGFTIDEFMASIAGTPRKRVPPVSLSLLRLAHLNFRTLTSPLERLARAVGSSVVDLLRGKSPVSFETLFLEYNNLLTAPFQGDGFEKILRRLFSVSGSTNDFRKLRRRLFIGTTDQDSREHVLFGEAPFDDVPISKAIQASISINPAFTATKIGGRYYMDGAVTRTSNFVEAIKKGSTLIFALDPFVPYVSKTPGFALERGVLFNADQDIRTLSFTRFEKSRSWVLRRHPEVSQYTFLPANRLRKVMSVNPMDHRPYSQIWKGAYLSTLQRIRSMKHRMAGDLAAHGLTLDTSRAEAVARHLESVESPVLSDFFPNGRLTIRRRAPKLEGTAPSRKPVRKPIQKPRLVRVHAA
jgi:predicted acylesterase/phospholipase RssA